MRRAARFLTPLALVLLCAAPAPAQELTAAEQGGLAKIAGEWIKLGEWAAKNGLGDQAQECVTLAEEAFSEHKKLDGLREKAGEAGSDGDDAKWEKKHQSAAKKVAGIYEKLAGAGAKERRASDRQRFVGYLWKAVQLEPNKGRWGRIAKLVAASAKSDPEQAARIADGALGMDPPEKVAKQLRGALDSAAKTKPLLRNASSHPMRYYIQLPQNYKRDGKKKWPVLVAIDGAESSYTWLLNFYRERRGLDYLIVVPCTFSNAIELDEEMTELYNGYYSHEIVESMRAGLGARMAWDDAGLLAVLDDLVANYETEDAIYITGFSGGGKLTYSWAMEHPEKTNGCAPACGVFSGSGATPSEASAEDKSFPIHIITGARDPNQEHMFGNPSMVGIEELNVRGKAQFEQRGFTNIKKTIFPDLDHMPAQDHVIDTFAPYMSGKKQRGDPQ